MCCERKSNQLHFAIYFLKQCFLNVVFLKSNQLKARKVSYKFVRGFAAKENFDKDLRSLEMPTCENCILL